LKKSYFWRAVKHTPSVGALKGACPVREQGVTGLAFEFHTTICVGIAASMASFILAGGEKGNRLALPHSRVMIHQPNSGNRGQASEVTLESIEVLRVRKQIGQIYSQQTGQNINTIARDMDRDRFMSAREAKNYGLVDRVAKSI
jgi:ATP-dependent Clp protease protease subunit